MGHSLNEHRLTNVSANVTFADEKAIFDFLGLEYKLPSERKNGSSIVLINNNSKTMSQDKDVKKSKKVKKIKYNGTEFDPNYKEMDLEIL